MQSSLYVSLSSQVAIARRLDTVARNVANMNTAGYRADEIKFSEVLSKKGPDPVSFANGGETYISRQHGGLTKTDNPLDIAIDGDGWLAVRTTSGIAYTRDGRMQMGTDGMLRSVNNYPVLDSGGLPIMLDPEAGSPTITADGAVYQGENRLGDVGLFTIASDARLTRYDNSAVIPDKPATPVLEFSENGFAQGYTEGSNVNPIREMTKMIELTRTFESISKMIDSGADNQQQAIRELGETS
ncbi:flagellar basal-body rod protein FlgF [Breoghania corrubedonensis]|uniref:Flagellar basal-body rod protein FlgF n=1 Tax=Breoghania corrubedonensis TaxID=665038 RepID=A0A2T5V8V6_9HYPH|nr:flagellar basal-body rod protein FlgF [Breoghania corrubedonensis]PTW60183.1 flagellar basal-body rod protein FlgF [Breoghania corrubedonensis]